MTNECKCSCSVGLRLTIYTVYGCIHCIVYIVDMISLRCRPMYVCVCIVYYYRPTITTIHSVTTNTTTVYDYILYVHTTIQYMCSTA